MPETKFTPGPWTALGRQAGLSLAIIAGQPPTEGLWIARTFHGMGDEQEDANAHLIAAAPDLYAAALELREAVAACFRTIIRIPGLADRLETELIAAGVKEGFGKRAGEALAKARGESQ